jgi:hypothetical protein
MHACTTNFQEMHPYRDLFAYTSRPSGQSHLPPWNMSMLLLHPMCFNCYMVAICIHIKHVACFELTSYTLSWLPANVWRTIVWNHCNTWALPFSCEFIFCFSGWKLLLAFMYFFRQPAGDLRVIILSFQRSIHTEFMYLYCINL